MLIKILLIVFLLTISEIENTPLFSGEVMQCFERQCPSRTTACKKYVRTSDDKKTLLTTISCLDVQNLVLKEYNESEDNYFGPSTTYEGTSFSGSYIFSGHNLHPINVDINNHVNNRKPDYTQLEDLA